MSPRLAYLLRRLAQIPLVLLVVTLSVFALIHVTPGDPIQIMLGMQTSPEAVAALQKRYHFDRSLAEQYLLWVTAALRGDLGSSIRQNQPVAQMIAERFPISLRLSVAAMLLALVAAIPAGILSAVRPNTWIDYLLTGLSIGGLSIPNFTLALLLIYAFAVKLDWFPITGIGSFTRAGGTLWSALGPFVLPAVALGAQNCHWEEQGAFTGEISPGMLAELGCRWVLLGHSERRHVFRETDEEINRKVGAALRHGMHPVLCVGETDEERRQGLTFTVVEGQLRAGWAGLSPEDLARCVLAYEPVWAIGTGVNATPAQAAEVHGYLRGLVSQIASKELAQSMRILYGGSVKPDNAQALTQEPDIDGALVGGASLQAPSFITIAKKSAARSGASKE